MWSFQVITIDSLTIRQDDAGRYCLNDLHKAAGGYDTIKPVHFFKLVSTSQMIEELEKGKDSTHFVAVSTVKGRNGGTFVCKELVYAYAMWISPAFNLKVIRSFDQLQTQGVAVAEHAAEDLLKNPLKYLEAIIGQAKELQAKLEVAQPKAEVFDRVVALLRLPQCLHPCGHHR